MRVVLFVDTGTAVTFFFTRYADLFFAKAMFSARRKVGADRERRVLTFPSGVGLFGELDFNLFVSMCSLLLLGGGLRLVVGVLVGSGEDAKRYRDAGLEVQGDDLFRRKICLPLDQREEKKSPLALFLKEVLKEKGVEEADP